MRTLVEDVHALRSEAVTRTGRAVWRGGSRRKRCIPAWSEAVTPQCRYPRPECPNALTAAADPHAAQPKPHTRNHNARKSKPRRAVAIAAHPVCLLRPCGRHPPALPGRGYREYSEYPNPSDPPSPSPPARARTSIGVPPLTTSNSTVRLSPSPVKSTCAGTCKAWSAPHTVLPHTGPHAPSRGWPTDCGRVWSARARTGGGT